MLVKDLGEQGLLKIVQRYCPVEMVGDDAAILPFVADQSLVVTTDMLVDQVHFSDRTTSPSDVGWRSAAANLSDLAAMGASSLGITVALGLTGQTPVEWVEQLYQGLSDCLNQYHTPIVGGDICRSAVNCISITAFGTVPPELAIRRSVAQPGDVIVVTGNHGDSRAGLELLLHPEFGQQLNAEERLFLIQAHQRPQPRLDVLPHLHQILTDYSYTRIAGMDSSDGLADALVQICRASQVGARIERSHIPLSKAMQQLVSPQQALEWALYGGEDFELVLCLPLQMGQQLVTALKTGATIIGEITPESSVLIVDKANPNHVQELVLSQGFQHFGE